MTAVDLLISSATVLTMAGKGIGAISNGAVAVRGEKIVEVGETGYMENEYTPERYMDVDGDIVMPGLVDAHIHTGLALFRGLAQDIDHWMQDGIWPFMQHINNDERAAGSLLNIIEGVKAGTTTFCDYDSYMSELLTNHIKVGTRARVCETINELSPKTGELEPGELYLFDAQLGQEALKRNIELLDEYHGIENERITCMLGPQGPDMVSQELLMEIKELSRRYDTMLHMHVAQGDRETNQVLKRYGQRSIPYLDDLGLIDEKLLAVHLTDATPEETFNIAQKSANMVLCSSSIGIIDGIIPPMSDFIKASGQGALGSDQAPGNNSNNMFNEMKMTAILNKCKAQDPKAFPAWKVIRMATVEAAKTVGLGDEIGSLEPGKKADLLIVDSDSPSLTPVAHHPIRNIVPNLVYSARGNEVRDVMVDGNFIMQNRQLTHIDEKEVVQRSNHALKKLSERVALSEHDSPLRDMMEQNKL